LYIEHLAAPPKHYRKITAATATKSTSATINRHLFSNPNQLFAFVLESQPKDELLVK